MIEKISLKNIMKFASPAMGTMFFIGMNVMIDGMLVSNFVNEIALSAVNIVMPVGSIVLAIGLMLGSGGNAICSTLLGEKRPQKAKEEMTLFLLTGLIVGLIIVGLIQMNLDLIIRSLGANNETYGYAYDFLKILSFFYPLLILETMFQNFMITAGKALFYMKASMMGRILRMVLGYIFLTKFDLGMRGVAVSTGITFIVSVTTSVIYLSGTKDRILHFVKPKFDKKALINACTNGSSEMVTNLSSAVTTFLFNRAMLNLVGNQGVAAITVIIYSQFLLGTLFMGYTIGVSPLIGFNYGGRNRENLCKLFRINMKVVGCLSAFSFVMSILLAKPIAGIFLEKGSEVYKLTTQGFRVFSLTFIFMGMNIFASGMFTAYSNGKISALISFMRTLLFTSTSIVVFSKLIGINGVWLAVPIAETLTAVGVIYFFKEYKKMYMYDRLEG